MNDTDILELVSELSPERNIDVRLQIGSKRRNNAKPSAARPSTNSAPVSRTREKRSPVTNQNTAPKTQKVRKPEFANNSPTNVTYEAASKPRSVEVEGGIKHQSFLIENYTFGTFIEGKSNQLARAASMQVGENPGGAYNPLFLYGGVGLGKTHLMHAVGNQLVEQNPDAKVVYLHSERFVADMVKALQLNAINEFKRYYRSVDALLIDDIQFFAGKERSQEEFFHTFNTLIDRGSQIVISSDRSPSELSGLEERIRSRLGWGLVVDIHPSTYELRLGILQSKAEGLAAQVKVPDRVLEFLAHRITSNIRELEGALNRIVAQATLVGRAITLEMAQEVLQDLLRAHERRITIDEIQKRVAEHYGIKLSDMHSARRARIVARPRQVAMYLAKQLTPRSLPEIGRRFGGRDHTTVMHAIRKIEELRAADSVMSEDIEHLRRQLHG